MFTQALRQIQAHADAAGDIDWLVQIDSTIVRAHQHAAATGRKGGGTGRTNRTITPSADPEADQPTTKIHLACDGKGRPLAILVTPGQRHDSVCALPLLERIRVPRTGTGRPRRRPDRVIADKAYSSRGFRAYLRQRGIAHTIPEKTDQRSGILAITSGVAAAL
ncbi:transposase [Streptomyces sp. NPDC012751]|uniref:transposase n=1 Tax=Streptomyces sp. NPDC012751 TaxID=3364846 RepID=UPI00368C9872